MPSTNQLLLQQEGSHFPQRTLWTITVSDNDTLDSTTADKKAIQWKRKSLAPLDRKLVGVWKSQTALDKVSFVEITAQSGFISCRWLKRHKKFHRVCNAGILTVGKGFLTVNTGGSKSLDIPYKLSDDSLKLTFGKQESSYSKTSEPEKLITEFP